MKIRRLKKEDIPELLNLRIEQQKEYQYKIPIEKVREKNQKTVKKNFQQDTQN